MPGGDPKSGGELLGAAYDDVKGMLRGGMEHPATKPVLAWGAMGALAGAVLPIVSLPLGFVVGAGYKLYKRASK
ncbi:MAG: hypothetical protein KDE55_16685 [Novosphingobium sp.]|nr:hypothetical protein [Novosphingobium sp.]